METQKAKLKGLVKTVATAGTKVQVSTTPLWARGVILSAPAANAGVVYFGDVGVSSSAGLYLAPGAVVELKFASQVDCAIDLSGQYVDAATNGDKLSIGYLEVVQ
jgi:hypothetical protein